MISELRAPAPTVVLENSRILPSLGCSSPGADRWALPLTEIIQLVLELNHSLGRAQCDSCGDIRWTCNWQHQQLTRPLEMAGWRTSGPFPKQVGRLLQPRRGSKISATCRLGPSSLSHGFESPNRPWLWAVGVDCDIGMCSFGVPLTFHLEGLAPQSNGLCLSPLVVMMWKDNSSAITCG